MAEVAEVLRLAPSEVQAVSTFYSMYFNKPAGDHHVLICLNVSCALRGADEIVAHVERRLGCPSGGTTADGKFTWESTIECLGACGGAPAMQVDHHFHEDLTPERVDGILERLRSKTERARRYRRGGGRAPERTASAHRRDAACGQRRGAAVRGRAGGGGRGGGGAADHRAHRDAGVADHADANPRGSRSRPRRRPRPDAGDL